MAEFTLLRGLLCRNCRLELVALGRAGAFLTSIRSEELVNEVLWKIIEQNHPATWKRINILLPAQTVPCPIPYMVPLPPDMWHPVNTSPHAD